MADYSDSKIGFAEVHVEVYLKHPVLPLGFLVAVPRRERALEFCLERGRSVLASGARWTGDAIYRAAHFRTQAPMASRVGLYLTSYRLEIVHY